MPRHGQASQLPLEIMHEAWLMHMLQTFSRLRRLSQLQKQRTAFVPHITRLLVAVFGT